MKIIFEFFDNNIGMNDHHIAHSMYPSFSDFRTASNSSRQDKDKNKVLCKFLDKNHENVEMIKLITQTFGPA